MTHVHLVGGADPARDRLAELLAVCPDWALSVDLPEAVPPPETEVLVYLAGTVGAGGIPNAAAARLLLAQVAHGTAHVVVVSSSAVYPPRHQHAGMIAETTPHRRGLDAATAAWQALEEAAVTAFADAPRRLTLLRAAPMPVPGGHDLFSLLLKGRIAAWAGHDPTIQLLDPRDLAAAVARAVAARPAGVFHIAPRKAVPLRTALRHAGGFHLRLPGLWHALSRRPGLRNQLRYSFTVSGQKAAAELEFKPTYSSAQAAAAFGGRPPESAPDSDGYDDFGWERGYIDLMRRTLFGFLHRLYWRVANTGLEHVPREGACVMVGIHRGFMPFDGTMVLYDMVAHVGRYPRTLIHPSLVKPPFLADFIRRLGGVIACRENGTGLLAEGHMLTIFPEGINGAFRMYRDAYTLGPFGRDAYVKIALRAQAPLVPFVTVGSAEIYPIVGRLNWRRLKRLTEWPFFPVTTPFPLPSKWHTRYLAPISLADYAPEDADNPAVVAEIGALVRARMQAALDDLHARRRHIFFGALRPASTDAHSIPGGMSP